MNLDHLMKQAEEMQKKMQSIQKEISELTVVGTSGAGIVEVYFNEGGAQKVVIDPSALQEGVEVFSELIAAAINDAVRKLADEKRKRMASFGAGLNLPGNLGSLLEGEK